METVPVFFSEDYFTDYETVDCEDPSRAWAIWKEITPVADFIEPRLCDENDLLLCHTERLIRSVQRDSTIYHVARKAAGGAIDAARIALEKQSFALIRPPGHHAGRNFNGGFCFFNNMAIAMTHLLTGGFIRNGLIVDIDLHFGNGTLDIVGEEGPIHFTNISAGTREEFFEQLTGALEGADRFDILGCSAGFDTYVHDWGGILQTDDFRRAGSMLSRAHRRFFSVLEGGYFIPHLGLNVKAFLEGILQL